MYRGAVALEERLNPRDMMKNLESSATANLSALSINRREFLIGSAGLLLMAGTFLGVLPPAVLFFMLQKEFIAGLTAGMNTLRDLLYLRLHADVERLVGRDSMLMPVLLVAIYRVLRHDISRTAPSATPRGCYATMPAARSSTVRS